MNQNKPTGNNLFLVIALLLFCFYTVPAFMEWIKEPENKTDKALTEKLKESALMDSQDACVCTVGDYDSLCYLDAQKIGDTMGIKIRLMNNKGEVLPKRGTGPTTYYISCQRRPNE